LRDDSSQNDDGKTLLNGDQVWAAAGLDDWRTMYAAIEARYRTKNFVTGLELVNRIGAEAETVDHHPDLRLTYTHVEVLLTSHDVGGITSRDIELARRISAIAADFGVLAEPATVARVELAIDTWDRDAIKPFWAAVLGLADTAPDELRDPLGLTPTIWFQNAVSTTKQRWHIDIRVPPEEVDARIAAAVAAGGTVVSTDEAPSVTVLADPQGNKVCICTHVGRT
jgi:4a-hydroxytetrahydrobiopterin dehydratase